MGVGGAGLKVGQCKLWLFEEVVLELKVEGSWSQEKRWYLWFLHAQSTSSGVGRAHSRVLAGSHLFYKTICQPDFLGFSSLLSLPTQIPLLTWALIYYSSILPGDTHIFYSSFISILFQDHCSVEASAREPNKTHVLSGRICYSTHETSTQETALQKHPSCQAGGERMVVILVFT